MSEEASAPGATRPDGPAAPWLLPLRAVAIALGLLALLAIGYAIASETTRLWRIFQIWPMQPIFADLRTIPVPADLSEGITLAEARRESPVDPWGRGFNYPAIWSYLMMPFTACADRNICFGLLQLGGLSVAYLLAALRLRDRVMLTLLPVFCLSPPVFLLVERGNNDAVVFLLLLGAALSGSAFLRGFLIGLAGGLKVFPVAALLTRPPRLYSAAWLAGVALSLPLLVWTLLDLDAIRSATPVGTVDAFGMPSLGNLVAHLAERHGIPFGAVLSHPGLVATGLIIGSLVVAAVLPALVRDLPDAILADRRRADLFLIFSACFLFVFLVTGNWSYRLVFLMPAALVLLSACARCDGCGRGAFAILLTALVAPFWVQAIPRHGDELINLLAAAAFMLVAPVFVATLRRDVAAPAGAEDRFPAD